MALTLPSSPAPMRMVPRLITGRIENRPAFGSGIQRIARPGSHYAFDIELPVMPYAQAVQDWGDVDDETETVVFPILQPGLDIGSPGSPLVAGAGQLGTTLHLDGLSPGYVIRARQWLSVITGGQRYLYRARTSATADGSGVVDVLLQTFLRVSPADNAVVEIAAPKIEGFATVPDEAWAVSTAGHVQLSFSIEER